MPKIAIVGTTSWGITMGVVFAKKGLEVKLWARSEKDAASLGNGQFETSLLSISDMPNTLSVTQDIDEALLDTKAVIMAVPSQSMRKNIQTVREYLTKSTLIISAAKGLELGTNKCMTQVIAEEIDPQFHQNICVLSGPNLYKEILYDQPAASVVAARNEKMGRKAQRLLNSPNLCVYTNSDVIGVEMGGALKNIIALGAGIIDGMEYGDNAKAAFITRGLTEITALGVSLGASAITFSGLAGLGDLIATCASPLSRNHYVGVELTKGRLLEDITATMKGVAEGITTTKAVWELAQSLELEMPITEKVYQVLYEGLSPKEAAAQIMSAEARHELTGRRWTLFSFLKSRKRS
jgi:glycerol-3-phosphate dehydrogenase (NAD(P)+)